MICENCGAEIDDDLEICPVCDVVVNKNQDKPDTHNNNMEVGKIQTVPSSQKSNKLLITICIISGVLIIIICVLGYFLLSDKNKSNETESFISSANQSEIDENNDSEQQEFVSSKGDSSVAQLQTTETTTEPITTTTSATTTTTTTTTSETTTAEIITTTQGTTAQSTVNFSMYAGNYSSTIDGETYSLTLNINSNGNYSWTFSFANSHMYSTMSNSGVADNAILYYDGVLDDYGYARSGYVKLSSFTDVEFCMDGEVTRLYKN